MSSPAYRGNLSVGGSALEKSKLQLRRPTPDSDVLASSDEDREHVPAVIRPPAGGHPGGRRPSTGWLQDIQPNRKFSLPSVSFAASQPTTPALELPSQSRPGTSAFPWNTSSFTSSQGSSRLKEVLPSPTSAHFNSEKPLHSPTTAAEGDDGIGFLLNQHNPVRKAVRSQSYSIGQGDIENSPVGQFSARLRSSAGIRHRPSKPSLLGESTLGLSQLREDEVDELESNGSEHGIRLPPGYWEREQNQALLKQAAMENARARNRATSTSSPVHQQPQPTQRRKTTAGLRNIGGYAANADYAIEEMDDSDTPINPHGPSSFMRRFSEQVPVIGREPEVESIDNPKKPQWATQNIRHMAVDALGRRHSFAHAGSFNPGLPHSTLSNTQEEDETLMSPRHTLPVQSPEEREQFDASAYFAGYGPASRAINASAISAAHPDPSAQNNTIQNAGNPYAVPPVLGRPGRRLFVVTFKCSRADIYYLYDNTGLEIRCGDLVIVEGDRGCDLGQVAHADVTHEEAKKHKAELNEEHFRWLVMFSQYSQSGNQDNTSMLGALARANGPNQPQMTGVIGNQDQDAKPKMIKRLAQQHEIMSLRDKEGQEAKAKRLGAQKAADHKLPMEILDAEYQADYHKLTYFYYAESYVNFNELVTDLFKQYKVRIWMSAVNPASVVNPAGLMQITPPSAIGPGAILNQAGGNASLPVGPGFGGNNRRPNEQYGRNRNNAPQGQGQSHGQGHAHAQAQPQGNYDEGYYAFSHQIPAYPSQGAFNMPWPQAQQMQQPSFDRYGNYPGGYPNASAAGSPMNYGGFYPPTSSYGGAPGYTRIYAGNMTTPPPNTNASAPANTGYGHHTTHGAGNGATPNPSDNDHSLVTAMHNLAFAPK